MATVIAHEIAHQWVGNLVTPVWWSEYWLSEGFATYFAALALNEVSSLKIFLEVTGKSSRYKI